MNTVQKLIQEIQENNNTLEEKAETYLTTLKTMREAIPNERDRLISISYHFNSYNGRKICFGGLNNEDYSKMIKTLIITNDIERFFDYLTNTVFPSYKNDLIIEAFHF